MELTINHLKGYAGTGLKMSIKSELYPNPEFIGYVRDVIYLNYHGSGLSMNIDKVKPILYPLSTLTDYREDLGFVPIENLGHTMKFADDYLQFTDNSSDFYDLHWMPHKCIELFQQWHIDYQNLISNNLAIDTRTLTKPLI